MHKIALTIGLLALGAAQALATDMYKLMQDNQPQVQPPQMKAAMTSSLTFSTFRHWDEAECKAEMDELTAKMTAAGLQILDARVKFTIGGLISRQGDAVGKIAYLPSRDGKQVFQCSVDNSDLYKALDIMKKASVPVLNTAITDDSLMPVTYIRYIARSAEITVSGKVPATDIEAAIASAKSAIASKGGLIIYENRLGKKNVSYSIGYIIP